MSHNHSHNSKDNTKNNALNLAFWLNLIFSIIELVGGILTNSTAIITDALHDFTDAMAIGMAVFLEKFSQKPANNKFTFGYQRFSLLSALTMSAFLFGGSLFMIVTAIQSFTNPKVVHSEGMLALAVLGIFVNGIAVFKIKNNSDNHAHAHSHNHNNNQNSKAIMLHLLEDLLGWVAVLIGAGVIYFTNWYWIDGALAICIALFIGFNAFKNFTESMKILLMATPENVDLAKLKAKIINIKQVSEIKQLRVWSLDGNTTIASIQLITLENIDNAQLLTEVKQIFAEFAIDDVTVQFETQC
ncbi:MAG: cation transporter [Moraxellaceae bacterium]|nr:cation transporter [Moraxellaceae bacterium]